MYTEKELTDALTTKYPGVDAKIIGRVAAKKAKTAKEPEDAKTVADGITLQQIIDSHADYRATEAQQTAVRNYETKYSLHDGKPVQPQPEPKPNQTGQPGQDGDTDKQVPAWAQELINANRSLTKKLADIEAEKTGNSRLEAFRKVIAGAPDVVKARYEKDFTRLAFKDEADFNAYLEEVKPDIQAMADETSRQGAHVGRPLGGDKPTGQASDAEAAAVVAKLNI